MIVLFQVFELQQKIASSSLFFWTGKIIIFIRGLSWVLWFCIMLTDAVYGSLVEWPFDKHRHRWLGGKGWAGGLASPRWSRVYHQIHQFVIGQEVKLHGSHSYRIIIYPKIVQRAPCPLPNYLYSTLVGPPIELSFTQSYPHPTVLYIPKVNTIYKLRSQ